MKFTISVMIFLLSLSVYADVPDKQKKEVTHLLDFIRNSSCEINRNGSYHSGKEAVKHIEKKYIYFKDQINSTEEFIELSATKSTLSGTHYMINCNGKIIKTKLWLLKELENFRLK